MNVFEAAVCLGLSLSQAADRQAILGAWRKAMRDVHPDKNPDADTTAHAQRLNAAKDILLARFESPEAKRRQQDEEERAKQAQEAQAREAREKEAREAQEAQAREQRAKEAEAAEAQRRFVRGLEREVSAKDKARRRMGKPRASGAGAAHGRMTNRAERKAFMEEVRAFFQTRFKYGASRVRMGEMLALFVEGRGARGATELERRLFKRHAQRTCRAIWPLAQYKKFKNKRCFRCLMVVGGEDDAEAAAAAP